MEGNVHACAISWRLSIRKFFTALLLVLTVTCAAGAYVGVASGNAQTGLQAIEVLVRAFVAIETAILHLSLG